MNESIDLLRCHFGLTLAEARLVFHLVAGESLRSAAAKLSITYETARSSLKNIFKKTETCRQAELVIVILTALPDCVEASVRLLEGRIQEIKGSSMSESKNEKVPTPQLGVAGSAGCGPSSVT